MATVVIQKRIGKKGTSYAIKYLDPVSGKKKHYKTLRKQKLAQQEANDLRVMIDTGKIPEKKNLKFTPLRFSEVAESLEKEWFKRLKKRELSEKTLTDYCIWLNVLKGIFEKDLLCQITEDRISGLRDEIADKSSNVNANKYLSILKKVCKHGLKIRAIINDPSAIVASLSEKDHERNRFLLPDELDSLIQATQQTRAKFYMPAVICLGAEHGAAKQEILSLRWPKIDFEFKSIGTINLFRTKNKKERTELLMPRTKKALLEWRAHLEYMRHRRRITEIESDHVFCHLDGTRIKSFNKAWWRVLEIAGIKDFHFHDLRHTFCSNLIMSGGTLKDAKEMIGHKDISMTDRYSHLTAIHKHRRQEQLANHYTADLAN